MPTIEVSSVKLYTEIGPVLKYIHGQLGSLWRDCVRAFINEVSSNISVDTGMSMASLYPLATNVRMGNIINELSRGFGPKIGHKNLTGKFSDNNAKYKSRELGRKLGRRAYNLEFGTPSNPELTFKFEIVVFQYFLLENGLGFDNPSTVWDSLNKGKEAFIAYWEENASKYINTAKITNYFLTGVLND